MNIRKAVLTVAGPRQRTLPMQTLIDRDGVEKSVLRILIEEVLRAGIEEIGLVVYPGDEKSYAEIVGDHAGRLRFVQQSQPMGYGHAVYCARTFTGNEPFLHLVGDHLYVSRGEKNCAQRLIEVAKAEACAVSAVQATRESLLPYYGTIGGRRLAGKPGLYRVETVIEKPTPTVAEQRLIIPGLRTGNYLCFFGMHVLTPAVMEILGEQIHGQKSGVRSQESTANDQQSTANSQQSTANSQRSVTLAGALAQLAQREQYLALEQQDSRYDIGVKYGLLTAQMALALNGSDREEVLSRLLELLAQRAM